MSDETLLDMAKVSLKSAELILTYGDDERQMRDAAYLAQQCVERMLKHYIEVAGFKYAHTHNIAELCDALRRHEAPVPFDLALVEQRAETITAMESKTRYVKNYMLSRNIVEDVVALCRTCLSARSPLCSRVQSLLNAMGKEMPEDEIDAVIQSLPGADISKIVGECLIRLELI